MSRTSEYPVLLPCPECKMAGHGGYARIGNRRRTCATCNNFAANVSRLAGKRLRTKYAEEYQQMLLNTAADLYPQIIEEFTSEHIRPADGE